MATRIDLHKDQIKALFQPAIHSLARRINTEFNPAIKLILEKDLTELNHALLTLSDIK